MASSTCLLCNAAEAKACLSCHSASYCSAKCQKEDWPLHKRLCEIIPSMSAKRPTPAFKLAFHFEVKSKSPELVWVNCPTQRLSEDDDTEYSIPNVNPFLGSGRVDPERLLCFQNRARKIEQLDHTIVPYIRDNALNDGSKPRQAVIACAGKTPYTWMGPVLVLSQLGDQSEPYSAYQDVTMADFRHVVDYFVWYGSDDAYAQRAQRRKEMEAMGFKTVTL